MYLQSSHDLALQEDGPALIQPEVLPAGIRHQVAWGRDEMVVVVGGGGGGEETHSCPRHPTQCGAGRGEGRGAGTVGSELRQLHCMVGWFAMPITGLHTVT